MIFCCSSSSYCCCVFHAKLENDWTLIVLRGVFCANRNGIAMDKIEHAEEIHVWNITECCSMATEAFNTHNMHTVQIRFLTFSRSNSFGNLFRSYSIASSVAHQLRIWFSNCVRFRFSTKNKLRVSTLLSHYLFLSHVLHLNSMQQMSRNVFHLPIISFACKLNSDQPKRNIHW